MASEDGAQPSSRSSLLFSIPLLTLESLGVVYGDLGTSPFYTISTLFPFVPSDERDIIGGCSLVLWTVIILVTIKYMIFILLADNDGEGGILALGALLRGRRSTLPKAFKPAVLLVSLLGAALLLGDGAFTPAVSVLTAYEGLLIVTPNVQNWIVPITVITLGLLFLVQPFGTAKIGLTYGPLMFAFFASMFSVSVWRITQYATILKAFNPAEAVTYVVRNGGTGYISLGYAFLAVTGLEAMYADMGHFGAAPIRLGWLLIVFPAVMASYLGQCALLIVDPASVSNPFFNSAPSWWFWPYFILATLAAVIASQSIISGSFSLASQAVNLGLAPQMAVRITSKKIRGQVFVPAVNWALMIITIGIVAGFGTQGAITNAFGYNVCTMMALTTVLFALAAHYVFRMPVWVAASALVFLVFDLLFLGAVVFKIPQGGWVAVVISFCVFVFLFCWWFGQQRLARVLKEKGGAGQIAALPSRIHPVESAAALGRLKLPEETSTSTSSASAGKGRVTAAGALLEVDTSAEGTVKSSRVPGMGIFLTRHKGKIPHSFEMFLERFRGVPEVVVFTKLRYSTVAYVDEKSRYTVTAHGNNIFTVLITLGFAEVGRSVIPLVRSALADHAPAAASTLFVEDERIIVVDRSWLWRWPLYAYANIKRAFPGDVQVLESSPNDVVSMGIGCSL